jgi:hypothetical protein
MKTIMIVLGTIAALGMATPSFAQGSNEPSANGGGHPGEGKAPAMSQPQLGGNASGATTGQGPKLPAPNAQTPGAPNNPKSGPTDKDGNVPSDNR